MLVTAIWKFIVMNCSAHNDAMHLFIDFLLLCISWTTAISSHRRHFNLLEFSVILYGTLFASFRAHYKSHTHIFMVIYLVDEVISLKALKADDFPAWLFDFSSVVEIFSSFNPEIAMICGGVETWFVRQRWTKKCRAWSKIVGWLLCYMINFWLIFLFQNIQLQQTSSRLQNCLKFKNVKFQNHQGSKLLTFKTIKVQSY